MKKLIDAIGIIAPFLHQYPMWVKAAFAAWLVFTAVFFAALVLTRRPEPEAISNTRVGKQPPVINHGVAETNASALAFVLWEYHTLFSRNRATLQSPEGSLSPTRKIEISHRLNEMDFEHFVPNLRTAFEDCRALMLKYTTGIWYEYHKTEVDNSFLPILAALRINGARSRQSGYSGFAPDIDALLKFVRGLLLMTFHPPGNQFLNRVPTKERFLATNLSRDTFSHFGSMEIPQSNKS